MFKFFNLKNFLSGKENSKVAHPKAALCILLALMLTLAACGGSGGSDKADSNMASPQAAGSEMYYDEMGFDYKSKDMPLEMPLLESESSYRDGNAGGGRQAAFQEAKLIYRADISLQTFDFEKTHAELMNLVTSVGGYVENSYIDRGSYYSTYNRVYGNFLVRVPSEKYETFLNAVGESSHVTSLNRSTQDVGLEYFDLETRLSTLKIKQERLQDLLSKATNMSDIIELENALSNTQYEIDSYSSELNRYDSLIGFSSININLTEVERLATGVDEDQGFIASLIRALKDGFADSLYSLGDFVMFVAYNLVSIIIGVAIIFVIFKFRKKYRSGKEGLISRLRAKRKAKRAAKSGRAEQLVEEETKKVELGEGDDK